MRSLGLLALFLIITIVSSMAISAQERQMGGVGITVFADQNFRGKSQTFRADVYDLQPLGLNDKISSIRVGPGEQWEVCMDSNFQGRCVVVSGEERDLRKNGWNDVISSMRRVNGGIPPGPPTQGSWYIVLFDRTNYRGSPTNYNGPTSDVGGRAQSVTIGNGVWELCERPNYGGRCIALDRSVPDLAAYGMRNHVYSVRPHGSGEPQPPPSTSDWYIVLFDQTNYRGTPTNYNAEVSDLGGGRRAQSVTIGRGVWELCENSNFKGRCVKFETSTPNLPYFLRNNVSSLRPVLRQPR